MSENKLGTCWAGGSRHSGWHAKRPSCVEWRPMIESNPIAVILDEAPVESAPAPEAEGQAEAAMPDKTETVEQIALKHLPELWRYPKGKPVDYNRVYREHAIKAINEALAQQKAEVERLRQKLEFVFSQAKHSQEIGACEVCADIEQSLVDDFPAWQSCVKRAEAAENRLAEVVRALEGEKVTAHWKEWTQSPEGQRCLSGNAEGEYLQNRLWWAFMACAAAMRKQIAEVKG